MRNWFKGTPGALLVLGVLSLLVAGGLGWATVAALQLENEQLVERAEAEHAARVRLALWRLDGYVAPLLAREENRPFDHFSTIFAPGLLLDNDCHPFAPGAVVQPSPLLHAELPVWMALHFQFDPFNGWQSPQVPAPSLRERLSHEERPIPMDNVTEARCLLLARLTEDLPARLIWADAQQRLAPPTVRDRTLALPARPNEGNALNESLWLGQNPANPNVAYNTINSKQMLEDDYKQRAGFQERIVQEQSPAGRSQRVNRDVVITNWARNGENWFGSGPAIVSTRGETFVHLGRLTPLWLRGQDGTDASLHLLAMRLVKLEDRLLCQGVLLDRAELQKQLLAQVTDLFPEASLLPVAEADPEVPVSRMSTLPLQLDPGTPPAVPEPGWTTLRLGLTLAWVAVLVAITAVALGGWSVLDLSERRMRFVSAVTHELRTPLTTLRLYLEMLLDGLVRDEKTRQEYLATLHAEAERLNRLVANVLDYSRLEKTRPQLDRRPVVVAELVGLVQSAWTTRCTTTGKQFVVESSLPSETLLVTDGELVEQILGNLIDNACKYSHDAADCRLWLRVRTEANRVIFEVEDRGPGIAPRERRTIFRTFSRGRNVEPSTGGVGLGLSLARRWAELLGGSLELAPASAEGGACFRLILPA